MTTPYVPRPNPASGDDTPVIDDDGYGPLITREDVSHLGGERCRAHSKPGETLQQFRARMLRESSIDGVRAGDPNVSDDDPTELK